MAATQYIRYRTSQPPSSDGPPVRAARRPPSDGSRDMAAARQPPSDGSRDMAGATQSPSSDGSRDMAGESREQSFPEWYRALVDEDSVKVTELLQGAPELLKEGWKENPHVQLEGWIIKEDRRWEIERSGPRPWLGRTALHVAARRGCSKLVEEIVDMFDDQGIIKSFSAIDVYGRLSRSRDYILAELLAKVDPLYRLDALAMAVVNGSPDIIKTLKKASLRCSTNPYHISRGAEEQNNALKVIDGEDSAMNTPAAMVANTSEPQVIQLRDIIEQVMKGYSKSNSKSVRILRKLYAAHIDFNYLPWEEYFFHFTFDFGLFGVKVDEFIQATQETKDDVERVAQLMRESIKDKAYRSQPDSQTSLLPFLFELQDGQGRTPLHVAIDGRTAESFLTQMIPAGPEYNDCLNVPDGAGRTPLYRAAAEGDSDAVECLLEDERTNLNATFRFSKNPRVRGLHVGHLLENNGFKSLSEGPEKYVSTALHIAIIHRHLSVVAGLLHDQNTKLKARTDDLILDTRLSRCSRQFSVPPADPIGPGTHFHQFGPISLAILAKGLPILQLLVKDKRIPDAGRLGSSSEYWYDETCMPGLHLAAALATPGFVQVFLDNEDFDPLALDDFNNTALHHAVAGRHVPFALHLVDFVSCKHFLQNVRSSSPDDVEDAPNRLHWSAGEGQEAGMSAKKSYGRRQGCVNMLLQAGVDVTKTNRDGDTARPGPEAHESFVTWWYEKVAKETSESRTNLNAAANAISVTAALVATASYVGPLQPPLSYGAQPGDQGTLKVQVTFLLVRVFIVCDTLSFYLAVASIILALIPALPMQQESMFGELRRSRRTVALAAGCLFPSIVSVLIAFAAGSLVVIPNEGSWNYGGLTLITAVLGGLVCLVAIVLFCVRFLRYLFYKSSTISRFYKATTF